MIPLIEILQYLVPDCQCMVWENDYKRIIWNDKRPMPTEEEIEEARPKVEEELIAKQVAIYLKILDDSMHDYIDSHYKSTWREYLQLVYADPDSSVARKSAAKAAGTWVKSIVEGYYKGLILRVMAGETLKPDDTNWALHFDATDPHITLFTLPE